MGPEGVQATCLGVLGYPCYWGLWNPDWGPNPECFSPSNPDPELLEALGCAVEDGDGPEGNEYEVFPVAECIDGIAAPWWVYAMPMNPTRVWYRDIPDRAHDTWLWYKAIGYECPVGPV